MISKPQETDKRQKLIRHAKLLAWLGMGWHGIEAAIAVAAGREFHSPHRLRC